MRIVSNERLVKRNSSLGKYATLAGMALLIGALVINIFALTRPEDPRLLTTVIAAFFVGFTLTNIGTLFNNRWGRRPDKGLADALKGLDDRFTLYSYRLGASHVLVGPPGAIILHPKYQAGQITYNGKKWLNPGARRGIFGLFNPDPLGNPVIEAAGEVEAFNRFIKKNAPELSVSPGALIVFLHPRAELSSKDSPIAALHTKQLKDFIRKLPRDAGFSPQAVSALVEPARPAAPTAG
jgi:hypothetical protein